MIINSNSSTAYSTNYNVVEDGIDVSLSDKGELNLWI